MNESEKIVISMQGVRYGSHFDEAALFEWLAKLKCVTDISPIDFEISMALVDDTQLCELIALCYRYRMDMTQLVVFNRKRFAKWFHKTDAYWFESVFKSIT